MADLFFAHETLPVLTGAGGAAELKPMQHLSDDSNGLPVLHRRDYCLGPVFSAPRTNANLGIADLANVTNYRWTNALTNCSG